MNMQLTPRVLRAVASRTSNVSRRRKRAARVAPAAPTAELSTRLVQPMRKSPVIEKKMRKGRTPARRSPSFSRSGIVRSSFGSAGPRRGWRRHRTAT